MPSEQNALWYKLYRSVRDDAAVRDAHQQFLLWRDYATIVLLVGIVLIPAAAFLARGIAPVLGLLGLLALQFGFATRAARVHGERLVCHVLALKSAEGSSGN